MRLNNKNNNRTIAVIISVFIVVPFILKLLVTYIFNEATSNNDWIGFYGTYFGSMIGVIGVYATMRLDQQKRVKERKDEMFLSNLSTYTEVVEVLSHNRLDDVNSGLKQIISSNEWRFLDTTLKKQLIVIQDTLSNQGEKIGVLHVIDDFVRSELRKEMEEEMTQYLADIDEEIVIMDTSNDAMRDMVNLIARYTEVELEFDPSITVQLSEEKLLGELKKNQRLSYLTEKSSILYYKLHDLSDSSSWHTYLRKRHDTFEKLRIISQILNRRINDSLNYIDEL